MALRALLGGAGLFAGVLHADALWAIGFAGQNCHAVCLEVGLSCDAAMSRQTLLDTSAPVSSLNCDTCADNSSSRSYFPAQLSDDQCCWTSSVFACGSSDSDARRICCCTGPSDANDAGCPADVVPAIYPGIARGDWEVLNASIVSLASDLATTESNFGEALDTIWMLLAAMLVFFMHAGFSMLEAGCVRFKNTQNILAKNLVVVTCGFLCWYVIGYPIALGVPSSPNKFGGGANFVMNGLWDTSYYRVWFFQGAFCATSGTIVSGSMAERTQLKGFATYILLMTSIIYPVVVWWGWSGQGMLNYTNDAGEGVSFVGAGFIDFAGSGIVHLTGGVGALVGAVVVGPRKDRWDESKADEFTAHSIPFCVLGTFFLWFGWYGFNPGSTLAMKTRADAYAAGLVACNTTLAPCAAGLVVFSLRAFVCSPKCLDVGGFCNGILAGLVAITAGCGAVQPWEALVIGFIGGFIYQGCSMLVRKLKIDDVVDAVAVHGANGLWGCLALGFFGDPTGVFYGGTQIGTQLVAVILIILWVGTLSTIIFVPLKRLGMLRMGDEFQDKGADMMEHSPPKAYADHSSGS